MCLACLPFTASAAVATMTVLTSGQPMRRREFITLIGGAAAWPLAAPAQQGERVRRIGLLVSNAEDDPQGKPRAAAFLQGLQQLGWTEGRNVQIDIRWGAADAASAHR